MPPELQNNFLPTNSPTQQKPKHRNILRLILMLIALVLVGISLLYLYSNSYFVDKRPQVLSIEDVNNGAQCSDDILCPIDYKCIKTDNLPGAKGVCVEININQLSNPTSTTTKSVSSNQEIISNDIVVPPIFSGVNWQETLFDSTKNNDFIFAYNNFKYEQIPSLRKQNFVQLSGNLWVTRLSELADSKLEEMRRNFSKYYENSLTSLGYSYSQDIDGRKITFDGPAADGPLGSIWGYVKIQNDRLRLIGLGYQITDYRDVSSGGPIEIKCPCSLELKIFVSDEVDIKQFAL